MAPSLPPDGVALHPARIRRGLEQTVVTGDRADASERPLARHVEVVTASAELLHDVVAEAGLDLHLPWFAVARVEGARKVVGVEARRVDRLLEVQTPIDVVDEEVERPLVLLVAARRPKREVWLTAAERKRRGQGRPRTLTGLERVRKTFLEPEHLRTSAERE